MNELDSKYINENKKMGGIIRNTKTDIVTNDRKTFYEEQNNDYLAGWYKIIICIYIFLAIVFFASLFLLNIQISLLSKIIFVIFFLLYPFVITPIVLFILAKLTDLYNMLPTNVYKTLDNQDWTKY
jgi:Mn2+/Fe2+ NRAMP family transporter